LKGRAGQTRALLAAVSTGVLTFLVYLPALTNQFVNWDDDRYAYNNIHIRAMNGDFFRWAFSEFYFSNWSPLTWMSHAADYAIWGSNPFGHHLTSVLLHAVNASLVVLSAYYLLAAARCSGTAGAETGSLPLPEAAFLPTAAATGLLFGIHPLHVESVAWVSERKDVLCAFFFLLSLASYLRHAERPRTAAVACDTRTMRGSVWYICSIVCFILALMSKPMAVTLPGLLLILDWYPLRRMTRGKTTFVLAEKIPFAVLSAGSAIITVKAQRAGGSLATLQAVPFTERLTTAATAIQTYLTKIFLPLDLSPFYPYSGGMPPLSASFLLSAVGIAASTAVCVVQARKRPFLLAACGSYILMLLPVIGIVQVGEQAMADRYTYLPTLGIFFLVSAGAASFAAVSRDGRPRLAAGFAPFLAAALVMTPLTVRQIGVWKDSTTLWGRVMETAPTAHQAYTNLGFEYFRQGKYDDARRMFEASIALKPADADALNDLAICWLEAGSLEQASFYAAKALEAYPGHAGAHSTLGEVWLARKEYTKALRYFSKALELDSGSPIRYYNVALAYGKAGRTDEACRYWKIYAESGLEPAERAGVRAHMTELHCL
jgi:protein O-mannosyl-transferase